MTTFEASPSNSSTQTRRPIEVDPIDPSLPFPKYSAAVRIRPQAAWRTLDAARRGAFTGELVFESEPEIAVYLDGGDVYWAGPVVGPTLGRQLVEAGSIDEDQLRRSSLSVAGVEHLGRMFELDESIDRGGVLVEIERSTARVIESLVSSVVSTVATTAYRHHPAGIRTWFSRIGIDHPVRVQRPLDLDDIPEAEAGGGRVDWNAGLTTLTREQTAASTATTTSTTTETRRPRFRRTALPRLRLDRTDRSAERAASRETSTPRERTTATADEMLRRPAGQPDATASTPHASTVEGPPATPLPTGPTTGSTAAPPSAPSTGAPVPPSSTGGPTSRPPVASTGPAGTGPSIPAGDGDLPAPAGPVHLHALPAPDAVVPDSVADSVRRALHAIEDVSAPQGGVLALIEGTTRRATEPDPETETRHEPSVAPRPASSPFPPPTPDMRAELVYARAAAAAEAAQAPVVDEVVDDVVHAAVDGDVTDDGAGSGRSTALRRLIGSLRRP